MTAPICIPKPRGKNRKDTRRRDPGETGEWRLRKRARIIANTPAACAICDFKAVNNQQLGAHVRWTHRIDMRFYYEAHENHPCQACGKKVPYAKSRPLTFGRMFCSNWCAGHSRKGPNHYLWNGGHTLDGGGYRKISMWAFPAEHHAILEPMCRSNRYDVLEHRAVMAISIGRALLPSETVHHKNADKTDNRRENLELFVSSHGVGIKASDLTCPHCGKSYA